MNPVRIKDMFAGALSQSECRVTQQEFEQLLRDCHQRSFNFAYRLTGNRAEAEDLVQEAYIRAYRFMHRYDASMPFQNWVYRILSNAFVDLVRKSKRWTTVSIDQINAAGTTWDLADSRLNAEGAMLHESVNGNLQTALNHMNPEFRTAILLSDVEGLSYEEIAEVMQCSVGTVRSRIHRGRNQLKHNLMKNCPEYYREVANGL